MSRFNKTTKGSTITVNKHGARAYSLSDELELYSAVVTTTLSNNFYETADSKLTRIISLVQKCDPVFVAKLAIYAREKMYLRTIPLILVVELAKLHKGDNLVGKMSGRVIQRADEITELLAYYQASNRRT